MKLYHGSNLVVKEPKILSNVRALDFGAGFYLTSDFEQAKKWATLTTKRRNTGVATVTEYDFDDNTQELATLYFHAANGDWLEFISLNRKGKEPEGKYDLIIGPVANDNTMPVINLYLKGSYSKEEALKRLLPQKLKDQYTFKTVYSLSKLHFSKELHV